MVQNNLSLYDDAGYGEKKQVCRMVANQVAEAGGLFLKETCHGSDVWVEITDAEMMEKISDCFRSARKSLVRQQNNRHVNLANQTDVYEAEVSVDYDTTVLQQVSASPLDGLTSTPLRQIDPNIVTPETSQVEVFGKLLFDIPAEECVSISNKELSSNEQSSIFSIGSIPLAITDLYPDDIVDTSLKEIL